MPTTSGPDLPTGLSPDEAFTVLGNETRLQILFILGDAPEPLSFSEVFDRCEYNDSSNFDYHLGQLVGHFIRKTDEGYGLRQRGRRVVEAILSGALTATPTIERTETNTTCPHCDGPIEALYRHERVELYCPDCGGMRSGKSPTTEWAADTATDILGFLDLPPAGVQGRTPTAVLRAAEIWTVAETQTLARDVCPRCSALVDRSIRVCESHDAADDHCNQCGQQFGATIQIKCTNCILEQESVFTKYLLCDPDVMAFMIQLGIDPIAPDGFHLSAEETILSTDPFEARFTFTGPDETLSLTVDDTLSVVDVTRHDTSEPI